MTSSTKYFLRKKGERAVFKLVSLMGTEYEARKVKLGTDSPSCLTTHLSKKEN